ncbi:MAG: sulfotransferase domain-containing protein [Bacteroidota bacterium]
MDRNHYLIIGGSTKCGTTSLFNYFEFHPGVCACSMKESRYFLEPEYKLVAQKRDHSGISNFNELFPNSNPEKVHVEATPDYLYSEHALTRIAQELPNAKMVFILRKPTGRLESWYKFARQLGLIEESVTLEAFVQMQLGLTDPPQHLRSLEQGCYSNYLERAYALFGKNRLMVCFYEELDKDPESLCKRVASFASVDPGYFSGFEFKIFNKSAAAKASLPARMFRSFKRLVKPLKQQLPKGIRKRLKLASHKIESSLGGTSTSFKQINKMNEETAAFIEQYYSAEAGKIKSLTGVEPPW